MREAGGRIVLMDFGTGEDLAGTSRLVGTPLYLAPEIFARPEGVGPERRLQRRRHALLPRDRALSGRGRDDGAVAAGARESPASTAARPAAGRARGLHARRRTRARQRSGRDAIAASASSSRACASRWMRSPAQRPATESVAAPTPQPRGSVRRSWPPRRRSPCSWSWRSSSGRGARRRPWRRPSVTRVAVLPFRDISSDPATAVPRRRAHRSADLDARPDPLAAGAVADLRDAVPRSAPPRWSRSAKSCASTTSSRPRCSVVRGKDGAPDRVRINARLIAAGTDSQIWAQQFERSLGDTLALQAEVARAIAAGISAVADAGRAPPFEPIAGRRLRRPTRRTTRDCTT